MRRAVLAVAVALCAGSCEQGMPCESVAAAQGCRAEWVCAGVTYAAQCPSDGSDALSPDCVCLKDGVVTADLRESPRDWCGLDNLEKVSHVRGACGWNVPYRATP